MYAQHHVYAPPQLTQNGLSLDWNTITQAIGNDLWYDEVEGFTDFRSCAFLAGEMDMFEQNMEEDQPLDLSMKTGSRSSSPSTKQAIVTEKRQCEESALCLIKDCGCNNHQPRNPLTYTSGEYIAPVSGNSQCPIQIDRKNGEGRCFDHIMDSSAGQQRQWELGPLFREKTGLDGSQDEYTESCYQSGSVEHSSARFSHPSGYSDGNDQKPHYLLDLSNTHTTNGIDLKPNGNNEVTARHFANDRGSYWSNSEPSWSSSYENTPNSHWRPFADVTGVNRPAAEDRRSTADDNRSIRDISRSAADVRAIADVNRSLTKGFRSVVHPRSAPSTSTGGFHFNTDSIISSREAVFSQASSPFFSSSGGSALSPSLTSCNASVPRNPSSKPTPRTICHSFASTVPLICNSSSGASSSKSLTMSRTPNPAIRVTRSPKTFHNEVVRAEPDVRGCPFLRPQDSRRLPVGRIVIKEKENLEMLEPGYPEGVKMPALDYLISKVLVERVDIPFKPCNTEIKKIYNGERKGRLRLVDLIELQVEESLKA